MVATKAVAKRKKVAEVLAMPTVDKWLKDLGHWLVKRYDEDLGPSFALPADLYPVIERAVVLIGKVEEDAPANASGEYKRRQLFALMMKEFPKMRLRWLALAMELAFCFGKTGVD